MKLHESFLAMFGLFILNPNAYAETTQCTEIASVPATVDQPGIYCLKQSLSAGPIVINADDVTLDMNNHSLTDYGNYGIRLMGDRVTIRNGSVTNGVVGVESFGSQNLVENMQISNTSHAGIIVRGRDSIVRNNRLDNLATYGIRCDGPADWQARNQIVANAINDFGNSAGGSHGISLSRCGITRIEDNTLFSARRSDWFSNPAVLGIIISHSGDVLVVNNRLSHWYKGIWYSTSASGKYMNNLTTSVAFPFTGGAAVGDNN